MHFDPMISKLITWGKDRIEAINRMEMALKNYKIKGVRTIIPFLLAVMQHTDFRYGYFDTGFIEHSFNFDVLEKMRAENEEIVAAIAAFGKNLLYNHKTSINNTPKISKWKQSQLFLRRM